MKYILIGGAEDVGKTGVIYRFTKHLVNEKGFEEDLKPVPDKQRDFRAILSGKDNHGKGIRIAINSATDTPAFIQEFKALLDREKDISIVISSIRDKNFYPRKDFFNILKITEDDIDIELPLAKITRRKKRKAAMDWYKDTIDKLLIKLFEELYL